MRTRRIILIALLLVSLFLTLASGFYATAYLVYILGAVLGLTWLWARGSVGGVKVSVTRRQLLVQTGDWVEERIGIENTTRVPKLWLQVEDIGTFPGLQGRVLGLEAQQYRSWKIRAQATHRGRFTLGPLRIRSGDPLGLVQVEKTFPGTDQLIVYPTAVPLDRFVLSLAQYAGEAAEYRSTAMLTPNVVSIRRYVVGDSLASIHWKSTAKHGRLMVKEFETEMHSDVWVVLDLQRRVHLGEGLESTEEYAVKAAASIAQYLLAVGDTVGLFGIGDLEYLVPPDEGERQRWHIYESLALCRAQGRFTLTEALASLGHHAGRRTALVVITPSPEQAMNAARHLLEGGLPGALVLLDPLSFGGQESLPIIGNLLASGLAVYLVKRGDDLAQALSPNGAALPLQHGSIDPPAPSKAR
ncbi:MAG: DUF58 domain-containing protein [Chloroflexi bacterium]|nr:DUF58 domain-containing protein [Chloroflexota bacterium]